MTDEGAAPSKCLLSLWERDLPRTSLEPTTLSLDSSFTVAGQPLSLRVVAPRAIREGDVELSVLQLWSYPFRLVRVAVLLPVECVPLESAEWIAPIECIIGNMTAVATLDVPRHISSTKRLALNLKLAIRACSEPCSDCIMVEISVPTGIPLLPGAAIDLRVSVAGFPATLRIPADGHIHTTTCNHKRETAGSLWSAARVGDSATLEAALAAGGSTEEALQVIGRVRCAPSNRYSHVPRCLNAFPSCSPTKPLSV